MNKNMIEKYSVSMSGMQVTLAIIVINIVIFIALNTITELSTELILYPELDMVLQRPWTLVTVFFSHEGIIHILGNMSLLLFFGTRLEKITSSKNVLLIYLISGFVGSLTILSTASLIGWEETVRGASAAVFGVVASYTTICPNVKILGSNAKLWLVALFMGNAITAILKPQISIGAGAHITGIIMGVICGCLLKKKADKKKEKMRRFL